MQGWDKAPYVPRECRLSWEAKNPSWTVIALSKNNIHNYVPAHEIPKDASIQTQSDVIRLYLLANYGGVWADATCLCLRPLDSWMHMSGGFWMYRGWRWDVSKSWPIPNVKDGWHGPCIWFMASVQGSYLAKTWLKQLGEMLLGDFRDEYYLTDYAFAIRAQIDPSFDYAWRSVTYADALIPGGPAALAERELEHTPGLLGLISATNPNVIKLGYAEEKDVNNTTEVIRWANR